MSNSFIKLENVWKRFKKDWVLKDVSLDVRRPGIFAIVGFNGSGKTTLIRIICGLEKPNRGVVKVLNMDIRKDARYKREIGVLLHENVLYEDLTVDENLEFFAKIYGGYSDLAKRVFKKLGLREFKDVRVKNLSFGWKKRANIVKALLNDPKVLLLDEPFAGLDEKAKKLVWDLICDLSKDRAVVFTSPTKPTFNVENLRIFEIKGGEIHALPSDQGFEG